MKKGFTLLEMLVVITIFSVLGILVSQSVILTLRGSKKSETTVKVRENLNYAMGIIERQLRNADGITTCPNPDTSVIDYTDQYGNATSFSCSGVGTSDAYVASGSARLTNSETEITSCSFSCIQDASGANPDSVSITFEAKSANTTGVEGSAVSVANQIYLRNY